MSFRKGQSPFFECTFLQIYPQESLTLKNQQWYYTDNTEKWTLYNTEWGETICQSYTMKKQESFISTTRRAAISSWSLITTSRDSSTTDNAWHTEKISAIFLNMRCVICHRMLSREILHFHWRISSRSIRLSAAEICAFRHMRLSGRTVAM